MSNIIKFNSVTEFQAYRKSKTFKLLGDGSEGKCYLGKDGLAYKDFTEGFRSDDYVLENVITTSECDIPSFAFPHTLFAVGDTLVGHTSEGITRDFLKYDNMFFYGLDSINFKKLARAYDVMVEDAKKLASIGIAIYDLPYNLMFDGERLVGIDTCGYYRTDEDVESSNINSVDMAIKFIFALYAEYAHNEKLDKTMDVKPFLEMVEAKYTEHDIPPTQYTKK